LSARQAKAGLGDAPWPPHYARAPGEPPRVMPSRARKVDGTSGGSPARTDAPNASPAPGTTPGPTGRRRSAKPLVEIARAATREEALAGFERWKSRHPGVVAHLEPADLLVDSMRGRFTLWYRIRVNLQHVPEAERPSQEPLDVDYDPWSAGR
jgi:bifunctional non-homologous end joining protein LigD